MLYIHWRYHDLMQATNSRLRRTFSSLAIRNYRLFWLGQLISLSGTWMQTTAQAWLVLKLTNSPEALGTVTVLQFLPVTLLTLFGGVLADRLPKRTVIICTQTVAALQAFVLAFLVLTNLIQIWQIYVVALVLGIVNAFDNPTRQAFVVEMVGPAQLQNAIALNSSLFNAARIIGPAVGGVVISTVGIGQAFLLNGLSFIPVLAGLFMMRPAEFFVGKKAAREKMFKQLGDGLRYAANTPDVLLTLIAVGVLGTFGYNFSTILPLIAKYVLHGGADVLGLLTSAMGVGSLGAALFVAGAKRASLSRLLGAAALFSVLLILVGLSRWLPLTLGLLLVLGVMSIVFSAGANTRLQLSTPAHLRGRVMSLYFLLFAGSTPIGAAAVGVLAEHWNVQAAIVLMGAICLAGVGVAGALARKIRLLGVTATIIV
jgi:MFS family permease